jgi:hypothetical protein
MSDGANPKDLVGVKKPRLSLVPPSSIIYQALAMANGAGKYGAYNFREKSPQASIYYEAAMRHVHSWWDREENAKDSGVPHLAHAIACLGILIDCTETGKLIDDRPPAGTAAALIEKWTRT